MSDEFLDPRLAERLTRAARAAQALSETLWEALQEELADPRSERVAELSERLGEVAAVVVSLAHVDARARELEEPAERAGSRARDPAAQARDTSSAQATSRAPASTASGELGSRAEEPRAGRATYGEPRAERATYGEPRAGRATYEEPQGPPVAEPAPPWEPPETHTPPVSPVPAVLIDELVAAESSPRTATTPEPPRARPASPFAAFAGAQSARPDAGAAPREGDPPRRARPEIEIRDERFAEGPTAWIDSIGRRLERHEQDRSPFAVLLVELVDVERLRHAEPAEELSRLTDQVEDALARVLRPADSLTRERPGRYWLLAPQTDGPGAQVLVERIARAVRSSASHRGTPLEVAVGVAVCPEDGLRASELAAHADVDLYAARAAGRSSVR